MRGEATRAVTAFDAPNWAVTAYFEGSRVELMPDKSERSKVPEFPTEAEEAQWWYDNRDMVAQELVKAIKDGTAKRVEPQAREIIAVKLSPETAEKVHTLAERAGVREEIYVRTLIEKALDEAA